MFPVFKGTYERGDDLKSDYPNTSVSYRDHVIAWSKDLGRSIDVAQLVCNRYTLHEVDEVIVQERYACFQTVCHTDPVFNDQQAMQKRFQLEIKRSVHHVLGRAISWHSRRLVNYVAKHFERGMICDFRPHIRGE